MMPHSLNSFSSFVAARRPCIIEGTLPDSHFDRYGFYFPGSDNSYVQLLLAFRRKPIHEYLHCHVPRSGLTRLYIASASVRWTNDYLRHAAGDRTVEVCPLRERREREKEGVREGEGGRKREGQIGMQPHREPHIHSIPHPPTPLPTSLPDRTSLRAAVNSDGFQEPADPKIGPHPYPPPLPSPLSRARQIVHGGAAATGGGGWGGWGRWSGGAARRRGTGGGSCGGCASAPSWTCWRPGTSCTTSPHRLIPPPPTHTHTPAPLPRPASISPFKGAYPPARLHS